MSEALEAQVSGQNDCGKLGGGDGETHGSVKLTAPPLRVKEHSFNL